MTKKTQSKVKKTKIVNLSAPIGIFFWLKENTKLSKEQICKFCNINLYEVDYILTSDKRNIKQINPIDTLELTKEEIERCEKDSNAELCYNSFLEDLMNSKKRKK